MGEHGVYLASQSGPGGALPAFQVRAIDTTAAGDAFNGGFTTGLMLGKSPVESAQFASAVAAISVTRTGAQPSMPTDSGVGDFRRQRAREQKQDGGPKVRKVWHEGEGPQGIMGPQTAKSRGRQKDPYNK